MRQQRQNALVISSSFPLIPHQCNRVVLPPYPSTQNTDRVTVEHSRAPNRGRQNYSEFVDGNHWKLTIALRRGHSRVVRNDRLLHDGPVFPGMARLSMPGDHIQGEIFTAMEAVSISLPASRFSNMPRRARWLEGVRPVLEPNTQIEQLGRLLLHLLQIDGQYCGLFGEGVIDALLAIMLDRDDRGPIKSRAKGAFETGQLQRILDFAEDHIGQPLDLTEWSAAFGLPLQEFSRRFQLATGSAPYAYFLRRRIERAKELMTGTDAPLVEIALDVGFCSQSHLTEAFRRVVGVSPGQWRRASAYEAPVRRAL